MVKSYNEDGMRVTNCCKCMSTYSGDGVLCCKSCYREVEPGEGDGCEYRDKVKPSIRRVIKLK